MKKKLSLQNIIFVVIIVLLIIPQSRHYIQVWLHKGLSYINQSSIIDNEDRINVTYKDWYLKADNDDVLNFNDTQGEVTFINFWATWCPPCVAEMPSIQALYEDYDNRVQFLFITNEPVSIIKAFKEKNNYTFPVHIRRSEGPLELKVRTIPRTFIINKKGEIVVDESGAVNWNSQTVRKQLDALIAE